jgi:hypothetical protein
MNGTVGDLAKTRSRNLRTGPGVPLDLELMSTKWCQFQQQGAEGVSRHGVDFTRRDALEKICAVGNRVSDDLVVAASGSPFGQDSVRILTSEPIFLAVFDVRGK